MKLLKLTIINIASIESAVIDFENGALADESCFLICGPTGSGKTTLLDAMCLALYNQTPRIAAASKESYTDLTENFGNDIKIDDSRFLMRRGTDFARVELVFTDINDQKLTACWQVERAKRKSKDNPIRKVKEEEWTLCDERGTVICSKTSEMKKLIPERLGLTFEQFCRTTLLAQGEFTKFLRSDESEKSAILEKLTGTEIYSEISKRIHLTKVERENAVKLLQTEIGSTSLLSEEEEKELTTNINETWTIISNKSKEEEHVQSILNILKEYNDNEAEYQLKTSEHEQHQQEATSDAHREKVQLITDWDHSTEARGWWMEKNKQEANVRKQATIEKELQEEYIKLVNGKLFYEKNIQEKEEQQKECEAFIESKKDKRTLYDNVVAIEQLIRQINNASQTIKDTEEIINKLEQKRKDTEKQQETDVKNLKKAEEQKAEKQRLWEEALEKTKPYDLIKLSNQNTDKNRRLTSLNELKKLFENYNSIQQELEELEKEKESLKSQSCKLEENIESINKGIEAAQKNYIQYQQAYNQVKKNLENSNLLKEIRNSYHEGDTCPLCGGIIHKLLTTEEIQSELQPMEEFLNKKQGEITDAITNKSKNSGELEGKKKLLNDCETKTKKKETEKEDKENKLKEHSLYSECPNLSIVQEHIETCEEDQKKIAEKLNIAQQLHDDVSSRNQEKENASLQVEAALTKKERTDKLILEIENEIKIKKSVIETNNRSIEDNRTGLNNLIQLEEWESNPQNYLSQLKEEVKAYKKTSEKLEQLKKDIQPMFFLLEQINSSCASIETIYPEWKNSHSHIAKEVSLLDQKWNDLYTKVIQLDSKKKTTEQEITILTEKLQDYRLRKDAIDEERLSSIVSYSINDISQIRTKLNEFSAKEKILSNNLKRCKSRKEEILVNLKDKGYQPNEKDIQTYKTDKEKEQNELKETIATHMVKYGQDKEKLENNQKNKESLGHKQKALNKACEEMNNWHLLHQSFGSSDGKKFRNIAQSYVLRHLLVGANHYLHQLTDRYELECNPGSLTILIRDKEAGGTTRPTTTISGGEGFLISLSLALGLSSLSKKALAMDTLFIDEGFGTLDHTYLSTVMDTLERLHQLGGKKIGIISHVESLKERITTQIQVIKENNTASRVEVVCTI